MPLSEEMRARQAAEFTRRFPQLVALPEAERTPTVQRAARHPLVWGVGLLILAAIVPILAAVVLYFQGDGTGHVPNGVLIALGVGAMVAILPAVFFVQGRVIGRLIARRLLQDDPA